MSVIFVIMHGIMSEILRVGDGAAFRNGSAFSRPEKIKKLRARNELESESEQTLVSGEAKFCSRNFLILSDELISCYYESRI